MVMTVTFGTIMSHPGSCLLYKFDKIALDCDIVTLPYTNQSLTTAPF